MDGFRHDQPGPVQRLGGEDGGLRHRRGPVVHRGVGDLHPRQTGDHGLVFVDRLEDPLADLRLVGGVGGIEFRTGNDVTHDGGEPVPVGPGPHEGEGGEAVPRAEVRHDRRQLHLRNAGGKRQGVFEEEAGGDVRKQVVERGNPDCLSHPLLVRRGVGNVVHRVIPYVFVWLILLFSSSEKG